MKLAVILPHTKLYGGVKRFLELGNKFIELGHEFIVFTPEGIKADWYDFKGETLNFGQINKIELDVIFLTEIGFSDIFLNSNARRKVLYHVREGDKLEKLLAQPNVELFACSTSIFEYDRRRYKKESFKAVGGIDISRYEAAKLNKNPEPFVVMAYGRFAEKRKGTMYVVKACEHLYRKGFNIELLLFDTPVNEKMQKLADEFTCSVPYRLILNQPFYKNQELYDQADLFVACEKKAGWANTVAEAMACGIPVAATTSGTKDFLFDGKTGILVSRNVGKVKKVIKQLYYDYSLRKQIAVEGRKQIEKYDWGILAEKILMHFQDL